MFKNVNAIIQDSVKNIIYRGNVVTGIVANDNGNKSYDVFINESEVAYPRIFTLSRDPDLGVGDKVRILYKNGDKNNPIILPPTIAVGLGNIYVFYEDNDDGKAYVNIYNPDGDLLNNFELTFIDTYGGLRSTCIDSSGNMFLACYDNIDFEEKIIKTDAEGNILASTIIAEGRPDLDIAIGTDGYIYTNDETNDKLIMRNPSTLAIVSQSSAMPASDYDGIFIYETGKYIIGDYTNGYLQKRTYTGGLLGQVAVTSSKLNYTDLALSGNVILGFDRGNDAWTVPFDLSAGETDWVVPSMPDIYCVGVLNGGDFLLINNSSPIIIARYTNTKQLVWQKTVTSIYVSSFAAIEIKAYPF